VSRASSAVALPRWVLVLLVGACAACLITVAFLLGRVTAKPPPAVTTAPPAEAVAPDGSRQRIPGVFPTPVDGSPAPRPATNRLELPVERPTPAQGAAAAADGLATAPSAGGSAETAAVSAYFAQMDGVAAQVKAAQDPQALAQTILDQTLSGNTTAFDELIATQRALQARMAAVVPPSSCREHHRRSLQLVGRAIALLERTRDAMAGKGSSDLAGVATEGRAIEEEARATDALANELRRAAGLPLVP
jgi:hypothetical protein